jgi:putative spermidine/putrescine transport system permease protein
MLLLSPILVPIIVIALGLYFYFASLGITGSELALVMGHAVYTTPFVIVTAMAGLRHVDQNLETAATIMGAGPIYTFFRVTLPLLKPAMFAGGLFAFLMSFDEVVVAYFISKAGSTTLPVKMFSSIQWEISPVLAAVSTFLTVVSLVICLIGALFQKKE